MGHVYQIHRNGSSDRPICMYWSDGNLLINVLPWTLFKLIARTSFEVLLFLVLFIWSFRRRTELIFFINSYRSNIFLFIIAWSDHHVNWNSMIDLILKIVWSDISHINWSFNLIFILQFQQSISFYIILDIRQKSDRDQYIIYLENRHFLQDGYRPIIDHQIDMILTKHNQF